MPPAPLGWYSHLGKVDDTAHEASVTEGEKDIIKDMEYVGEERENNESCKCL